MQRTVTSAVALLMLVPFASLASANSENDAGTGGDAPNDSGGAIDLAFGSYTGAVNYSGGDLEDWYAFTVPTGATLEVDFRATSGGLYGGIYDDNGTLVQNAYSTGGSAALKTDTSGRFRVGFGDQNGLGNASYAFAANKNATLAPQNDAGSGGDAPAYWGGLVLSTGNFSGELVLADGDTVDAYTAMATALNGQHLCMAGRYTVHVEGEGAQVRLGGYGSPVLDTPVTFRADSCVSWSVEVTDAAANSSGPVAYSMKVTTPSADDLPDFAVSELRVSNVPFNGPFGPSNDSPFEKVISFRVSNAGGSSGTGIVRLDVWGNGATSYEVSFGNVVLAPGESRNYTYHWSTVGVVGTVNLAASAYSTNYDRDASNNLASTRVTLVVALPYALAVIPPPLVFVPNSSPNGSGQAGTDDTVCNNAVVGLVDHPNTGGSGPWPRACEDWNGKLWLPLINVDLCDRYGNSTTYNVVAQQLYNKPPCSPTLNETVGSLVYAP